MSEPIRGQVTGQALSIVQDLIAADTNDFLTASFTFSSEWDGLSIWAHFSKGDKVWDINLRDGKIERDQHLNLDSGTWEVYLHGTKTGMRVTTVPVDIRVRRTGMLNGEPLPEIPLTDAEQIDLKAQSALDIAQSVRNDAEEGKFNGKKGESGGYYSPSGVDGKIHWIPSKNNMPNIPDIPIPSHSGGAVDSVNGKTGKVILTASDVHALSDTTEIPTKLPNPKAITFIGAVNATYDGSEPVMVDIPSGGGGGGENRIAHYVIAGKERHQVLSLDTTTNTIEIDDASAFPDDYDSVYDGMAQVNPSSGDYSNTLTTKVLIDKKDGSLAAKKVDGTHIKLKAVNGELVIPETAVAEYNEVSYGRTPNKIEHTVIPENHKLRIMHYVPNVQNLNSGISLYDDSNQSFKNMKNHFSCFNRDTIDFQTFMEAGAGFSKLPGIIDANIVPYGDRIIVEGYIAIVFSKKDDPYSVKRKEFYLVFQNKGISKITAEAGNYEAFPTGTILDIYDLGAVN